MSDANRQRTLAELADAEAPMDHRRAAAVLLAVTRELDRRRERGIVDEDLDPDSVVLGADGSVALPERRRGPLEEPSDLGPPIGTEAGAAVGRLYFLLLVGRAPLRRDDAFEPVVRNVLSAEQCALLARSFADAPGQWPTVDDWRSTLGDIARGMAAAPPPSEVAATRRRQLAVAAGLVALVVITLVVVLAVPRWWDAATDEDTSGAWLSSAPGRSSAAPLGGAPR
jgi:hypothetical protein